MAFRLGVIGRDFIFKIANSDNNQSNSGIEVKQNLMRHSPPKLTGLQANLDIWYTIGLILSSFLSFGYNSDSTHTF